MMNSAALRRCGGAARPDSRRPARPRHLWRAGKTLSYAFLKGLESTIPPFDTNPIYAFLHEARAAASASVRTPVGAQIR